MTVDGYKIHEPKYLECDECGARELLTEEPSPDIDDLDHDPDCSNRLVKSEYWETHFLQG